MLRYNKDIFRPSRPQKFMPCSSFFKHKGFGTLPEREEQRIPKMRMVYRGTAQGHLIR
jgi:hypothetical protein